MDDAGEHPQDGLAPEPTPEVVDSSVETTPEGDTTSTPPTWQEGVNPNYLRDTVEETLVETEKARSNLETQFTKARQDALEQRLMGEDAQPETDALEARVQPIVTAPIPSTVPPEAIQAAMRGGYTDPTQAEAIVKLFQELTPLFVQQAAGRVFDSKINTMTQQQEKTNRAIVAKAFLGEHPDIAQDPNLAQDWFNRVMGEGGHNVHNPEDAYFLATRPRQAEVANARETRRQEDATAGAGIKPSASPASKPRSNDPLDWMSDGIPTGDDKIF